MSRERFEDLRYLTRISKFDKRLLTWYKAFPSIQSVPDEVPAATIAKYRGKFRAHYTTCIMLGLSTFMGVLFYKSGNVRRKKLGDVAVEMRREQGMSPDLK